ESAIDALQTGYAMERCRDRSERSFAGYSSPAILGRNRHFLGRLLMVGECAVSTAGATCCQFA
ncbi:MAG: hypothetical protein ACKPJJ_04675, partial [Planctomycetaceae bacterium]